MSITIQNLESDKLSEHQDSSGKIELTVLNYYKSQGYSGIFAENNYWIILCSIIYRDFLCNSDTINIFDKDFFNKNIDTINAQYKFLKNTDLKKLIKKRFSERHNYFSRQVANWNEFSQEQIIAPLEYLSDDTALRILNRMLLNFDTYRSGFPDLIIWRDNELLFIEVKSRTDSIRESQIRWHNIINYEFNQNIKILTIDWIENKQKLLKSNYELQNKTVNITIRKSSSKNFEENIEKIKSIVDGKLCYIDKAFELQIEFNQTQILCDVLDLISRWRTVSAQIDNKEVNLSILRENVRYIVGRQSSYDDLEELSCEVYGNVGYLISHELQNMEFQESGYINPDSGEWFFDKELLRANLSQDKENNMFNPFFNYWYFENLIESLPDKVDPSTDTNWSYKVSNDYRHWIYLNSEWKSEFGDKSKSRPKNLCGIKRVYSITEFRESPYSRTVDLEFDLKDIQNLNTQPAVKKSSQSNLFTNKSSKNLLSSFVNAFLKAAIGGIFKKKGRRR